MIFSSITLELFLRVMVLRAGGEAILDAASDEMQTIDNVTLFIERVSESGIKLTTVRIDESRAGHA